jgi:hypothetical protein
MTSDDGRRRFAFVHKRVRDDESTRVWWTVTSWPSYDAALDAMMEAIKDRDRHDLDDKDWRLRREYLHGNPRLWLWEWKRRGSGDLYFIVCQDGDAIAFSGDYQECSEADDTDDMPISGGLCTSEGCFDYAMRDGRCFLCTTSQ